MQSAVLFAVCEAAPAGARTVPLDVPGICDMTGAARHEALRALRLLDGAGIVALGVDAVSLRLDAKPATLHRGESTTLAQWLERVRAAGEKPIPEGDSIFDYAESVGLDQEMLQAQWHRFKSSYLTDHPLKRYTDWRAHFRKSVRQNWYRLWFVDSTGAKWASNGQQALAEMKAARTTTGSTT